MGIGARRRRRARRLQGHAHAVDRDPVIDFLAFSADNPSSIKSCIAVARHNARAERTALTMEMWEAINSAWLDLKRFDGAHMDRDTLNEFLTNVKEACLRFDGAAYRAMLRSDAYFFLRLGVYLERADSTARILDVKYHLLLPEGARVGGGLDYFQWASILRSVSSLTAYRWVYHESLKPWLIADLLVLNQQMPRSLASCYNNLTDFLDELSLAYGRQGPAQRTARSIAHAPAERRDRRNLPAPRPARVPDRVHRRQCPPRRRHHRAIPDLTPRSAHAPQHPPRNGLPLRHPGEPRDRGAAPAAARP